MRNIINVCLGFIFICQGSLLAQSQEQPCGTDTYNNERMTEQVRQAWQSAENSILVKRSKKEDLDTTELVIPVVFHIVHDNGPEKISISTIESQLLTINEAFNKSNRDRELVRHEFKELIADAHIRFELAKQDPKGECTNGINYIAHEMTYNAPDEVKYLSMWDSRHYLNIWVVNSIDQPSSIEGVLAGYATLPWVSIFNRERDGIVVGYRFVGQRQKTLVHEIGHYLGLLHTFQGGCSPDHAESGDLVEDTPPVAEASFGWHPSANTCHTDQPDLPDMIENYMDYSDGKLMFTPMQVVRMRLNAEYYREGLISSSNLKTVLTSPCVAGIDGQEQSSFAGLSIFPNPANERFTVAITSHKMQFADIDIVDMSGRVLYSHKQQELNTGTNTLALSEMHLNPGVYFVQARTLDSMIQGKLVIVE